MTATVHIEYKCDICGHRDELDFEFTLPEEFYFSEKRLDYEGDVNYHSVSVNGKIELFCNDCFEKFGFYEKE